MEAKKKNLGYLKRGVIGKKMPQNDNQKEEMEKMNGIPQQDPFFG